MFLLWNTHTEEILRLLQCFHTGKHSTSADSLFKTIILFLFVSPAPGTVKGMQCMLNKNNDKEKPTKMNPLPYPGSARTCSASTALWITQPGGINGEPCGFLLLHSGQYSSSANQWLWSLFLRLHIHVSGFYLASENTVNLTLPS